MATYINKSTFAVPSIVAVILASFVSQVQAVSVPVDLTGWTEDMIAEAGAASPLAGTTNDYTPTTGGSSWTWFEAGAPGSGSWNGIPSSGSFVSALDPTVTFEFQPFSGNNVVQTTTTLTLNTPGQYKSLAFLVSGTSGTWNPTLNFSDASSTVVSSFANPNWTVDTPSLKAYDNTGVVNRISTWTSYYGGSSLDLLQNDYTLSLADQAKTLQSITFTPGTGEQILFAVSGDVIAPVPEPSTALLLGIGIVGITGRARRHRRATKD